LHCSPKQTPAGQQETKDLTKKSNRQVTGKLKLGANLEVGLEGILGWNKSTGIERVRFTSAIMQMNIKGVFTWGFEVNDEREKLLGLQLSGDSLPHLSLEYLEDAGQPLKSAIPQELTVEISAFWSLMPPRPSGNWWCSIFTVCHVDPGQITVKSDS
jgi:hypothetical protein